MFYKWKDEYDETRQDNQDGGKNPFLEWLQLILGLTTTTSSPPLEPPASCEECHCGKINNNRIVGGTETGINQCNINTLGVVWELRSVTFHDFITLE